MTETSLETLHRAVLEAPMLDGDVEGDLLRRIRDDDDPRALDALLTSHLRLVWSIAKRFASHGVAFEELVAEGNLGLVEAARRFDPSKGVRFSTYATWWVRALIRRHTLANRRVVAMPSTRAARRILRSVGAAERRLHASLGRAPTRTELADELGETEDDVALVLSALSARDASYAVLPESAEPPATTESPEEQAARREEAVIQRRAIDAAIAELEARERTIVERRLFGDPQTLSSLGDDLGLSRERVRQLEVRARGKLREALLDLVA